MKKGAPAPRLRLSPRVTWHGRGEAVYAWHGLTGDVCEMSRDVAALCLAFVRSATVDEAARRAGDLSREQVDLFVQQFVDRMILEVPEADQRPPHQRLAEHRPYVPRHAVWERRGGDAIVWARATSIPMPGMADLLDAADGTRSLEGWLRGAASGGPRAFAALLRLVAADVAALKLLPPGEGIPRWAESTMPWPASPLAELVAARVGSPPLPDPAALADYHRHIADAEAQFEETETTLSHLFRAPHPALGGMRFGDRLAEALVARGVPASGARVVEVGGGLGWVGRALSERLAPSSYVIVDRSPQLARAQRARGLTSVVGDALRLPIADGAVDLLVSNEMAGDLGSNERENFGALALVDEVARVLAPGGLAWVSEFGHPSRAPVRSDHLDHDEYSIRFGDLRARARVRGLEAELQPVPKIVGLDGEPEALVTTRASFAALRALFRSRGSDLDKRAWLMSELRAHATKAGLDLDAVHGVVTAPVGVRTMGLVPDEFWALLARKPSEN